MGKLTGKWALVTGSTRGIGQQITVGLAQQGCNVIVHGRKLESTKTTMDMLTHYNVETHAVAGELSSMEGIQAVIDAVHTQPGQLDILINNAALGGPNKSIWDTTIADYNEVFQVNVYAIMELCRVFAAEMKAQGWGRIVNMSSGIAKQPNLDTYSLSKAMVNKYSEDLATELAGSGVCVNALNPGWLKTDMGGADAPGQPEDVIPGILVAVLSGVTGRYLNAPDYIVFKDLLEK